MTLLRLSTLVFSVVARHCMGIEGEKVRRVTRLVLIYANDLSMLRVQPYRTTPREVPTLAESYDSSTR